MLGPIIEKLASQANGRWELVKVDTEAHPHIAQQYDVRGIPNLKLFVDGKVISEQTGALPENALQQWLDQVLPSKAKALYTQALQTSGAESIRLLRQALQTDPGYDEAALELALRLVGEATPQATEEATALAQRFRNHPRAEAVLNWIDAMQHEPRALESDYSETVTRAVDTLRRGDFDRGAQLLLEVAEGRKDERQLARRLFKQLFTLLGHEHAVTKAWRRKADIALN